MKPGILVLAMLVTSTAALAHGPRYYPYHHSPYWWVAPAVIGGAVTYAMTRPQPAPQPAVVQLPPAPAGYHYENILDAGCNCYRMVLVNNQ
jgi:hypothetical protein